MFTDVLTVLYVADIERSLRLYRDAFGMAETYRFPRTGCPSMSRSGSARPLSA